MTRLHLALAAGLSTVIAFAAGRLTATLEATPTVRVAPAAQSVPVRPEAGVKTILPDPSKPAPKGIELGNPPACGFAAPASARSTC